MTFNPETRNELQTCPTCNARTFKTIRTRKTSEGFIRRRRECTSCTHRATTYEVSEEFYDTAVFFKKIANQIHTHFGSTGAKPCEGCRHNVGGRCDLEFPEYGTPEARDCTFSTVKS